MISLDAITVVIDAVSRLAVTIAAGKLNDPIGCTVSHPELPDGILGELANDASNASISYAPNALNMSQHMTQTCPVHDQHLPE